MPRTYVVVAEDGADDVVEALANLSDVKSVERTTRVGGSEPEFSEGDYALDRQEPTPSPEMNTVEVVDVTDIPANEFYIEETGLFVSEHDKNKAYHAGDRVIAAQYTNMDTDKVYHFPESRLDPV